MRTNTEAQSLLQPRRPLQMLRLRMGRHQLACQTQPIMGRKPKNRRESGEQPHGTPYQNPAWTHNTPQQTKMYPTTQRDQPQSAQHTVQNKQSHGLQRRPRCGLQFSFAEQRQKQHGYAGQCHCGVLVEDGRHATGFALDRRVFVVGSWAL